MKLTPYLSFNGQCEAAFAFYAKCLGGTITFMMRYGEAPQCEQTPADWLNKVMHVSMSLGDQILAGADAPPEHYQKPQGISVTLHVDDAAEAERLFHALAEDGAVRFPIQETFWAQRFGMCVDRFGTPWMINCGKPA